ncbi:NAD(P)-binding protein [Acaromyces ingoldii]|uniref:NAD(P)-binding protein n=1 Tax=Acaromyces ingoldii TaxID=215250 RepID=A0A316YJL9_9BASI|nr:NAD(P)-binding protein [Acaromyces ingoldii]PWN88808.1 NAD(P)-binding protein [Acaromyces ingoldii]
MDNPKILFVSQPVGFPVPSVNTSYEVEKVVLDDFRLDGGILIEAILLSLDPYMRGRMNVNHDSYIEAFVPGKPLQGFGVARVVRSGHHSFHEGQMVTGMIDFSKISVIDKENIAKISRCPSVAPLDPSAWLGPLGIPGFSAFVGLRLLDELMPNSPEPGNKLLVSGASGGVGMVAGQLARQRGWQVVAVTGSDRGIEALRAVGTEYIVDRRTNIHDQLRRLAPLQAFFDGVGGEVLDAFLAVAAPHATIIACGMLSQFGGNGFSHGIRNPLAFVTKSITLRGFVASDYLHLKQTFLDELMPQLVSGDLQWLPSFVQGFDNLEEAFVDQVLRGNKVGKVIVKV